MTTAPHPQLLLASVRSVLVRLEESIIFSLLERAQFKVNEIIYRPDGIPIKGFNGSFLDYLLHGTETLYATVRRYTSPDEHPFFDKLPEPVLPVLDWHAPIQKTSININAKIKKLYEQEFVPAICQPGDDENYGSSALCDVTCLQALSKRIHYGKFVAETKFQEDRASFKKAIAACDREALTAKITSPEIETKLLQRVQRKATTYCREIDDADTGARNRIDPAFIPAIYKRWIIPLTKEVEVEYLLARGD